MEEVCVVQGMIVHGISESRAVVKCMGNEHSLDNLWRRFLHIWCDRLIRLGAGREGCVL